ncbi:MAG: hypothetical protein A07HB70_02237 [uncultured archaeon A07HB70]|nr:MAG: hypothetical protein A07HB70_02237 [uncultured archaeon A07HB70]
MRRVQPRRRSATADTTGRRPLTGLGLRRLATALAGERDISRHSPSGVGWNSHPNDRCVNEGRCLHQLPHTSSRRLRAEPRLRTARLSQRWIALSVRLRGLSDCTFATNYRSTTSGSPSGAGASGDRRFWSSRDCGAVSNDPEALAVCSCRAATGHRSKDPGCAVVESPERLPTAHSGSTRRRTSRAGWGRDTRSLVRAGGERTSGVSRRGRVRSTDPEKPRLTRVAGGLRDGRPVRVRPV